MIDTGTESFPMVAIFMPLVDAVCAESKIAPPLREIRTLSVGENKLMERSKEVSKTGRVWLIVSGAM